MGAAAGCRAAVGRRPDGARPDGARPDGARPDGARPDGATAGRWPTRPGRAPRCPGSGSHRGRTGASWGAATTGP
ncbi:hypothetical protein D3230_12295 [Leucobacter chromiireducens subsp. solipictus]|uniref:Uncharacterized protein n=1 Tax=Leucobacter chromiireducens subsp. solipictus TaxID=398235 RepID=A0ABS1SIA5_9MICO|nr:hypothetical protein [Leucobacter chromiireducens subsp. solipictus]